MSDKKIHKKFQGYLKLENSFRLSKNLNIEKFAKKDLLGSN